MTSREDCDQQPHNPNTTQHYRQLSQEKQMNRRAAGTVTTRLFVFDTEDDLREHALHLNARGYHPDVAIMDARGHAVLACVAGIYADEFRYYTSGEDGYMHPEGCCECESERKDWKPQFPVTALAVAEDKSQLSERMVTNPFTGATDPYFREDKP